MFVVSEPSDKIQVGVGKPISNIAHASLDDPIDGELLE